MNSVDTALYKYQRNWLNDSSRLKMVLKARQIGFSTVFGLEALLEAVEHGRNVLLVSASERQSKDLLNKVAVWDNIIKRTTGKTCVVRQGKTECGTINGGTIYSFPANPATIRGFSGSVFLDEFAFQQNDTEIFKAVFPMITRNQSYRLRVASTPLGDIGRFYQLWTGDNQFSKHRVSLDDAIADGLQIDKAEILATFTQDEYEQEFNCAFIRDGSTFIPIEMLQRAWMSERLDDHTHGNIFIGVDIGRNKDLTILYVVEELRGILYERDRYDLSKVPFAEQRRILTEAIHKYSPTQVYIDSTGIGLEFAEYFETQYRSVCKGIVFTNEIKARMAMILKDRFERATIKIASDRELTRDLLSIRKKCTMAGNVSFEAATSQEGHADRFWALALAAYAAKQFELFLSLTPASFSASGDRNFNVSMRYV